MKKIIKKPLFFCLNLLIFISIHSYGQELRDDEFMMIREDFLEDFGLIIVKPCCNEESPSNLRFNFSFGTVTSNHDLIQQARIAALNAWLNLQKDLMKQEIGKRFDKSYPNFEQARNDYFKNWERSKIISIGRDVRKIIQPKIQSKKNLRKTKIRNLKLLDSRIKEINIGNLNESNYNLFDVNGINVGSLTSLNQINTLRASEITSFGNNENSLHQYQNAYNYIGNNILNDMALSSNRYNFDYDILNEILKLHIKHYNTIGNGLPYDPIWYQLDLMQQYLNNITYPIPAIPPQVSTASFASEQFVEDYAFEATNSNFSLFHPEYYKTLPVYQWMSNNLSQSQAVFYAKKQVEEIRNSYINNLLEEVDSNINYIISAFNYSEQSSEAIWLNSNSNEANRLANYLKSNNNSREAIGFGKKAFEALNDGGEVDYYNQLIKDKTFIGTKADCVLKSLIKSNNNLLKRTVEAFTQNRSKFRIKFTTYNNPVDLGIARTGLPDSNDVVNIKFNLARINQISIEMAGFILHEAIHAELHRIKLTNNSGPNPLPVHQYKWYLQLWQFHDNGNINYTATQSEHDLMSNYYIEPIARGLRQFDRYKHPTKNYRRFAWTGLEPYGKRNNFITSSELLELGILSQEVLKDNYKNECEK